MFDRDPIMNWVHGRIALLGDAAHPPLQYMAQGAIIAIEDGWVLAEHVGRQLASGFGVADLDWDVALSAYNAVRPEHCRRVLTTGRVWGEPWHLDGIKRLQRNAILRARDTHDYTFTECIYGNTALFPEDEPPTYPIIPLDSVDVTDEMAQATRELVTVE
jgi:3-hydroxybenzoate 6-monooxygenase